jgi:hypothetical protein
VTSARQSYVEAVVRHYVRLPGTPVCASRRDRRLAAELYERRVPLTSVWAAFVIAAARRTLRGPQQRKLETVRTLFYFVPAIDEVLDSPPDPGYVRYLAAKLQALVAEKDRLLDTCQKSAGSHRR